MCLEPLRDAAMMRARTGVRLRHRVGAVLAETGRTRRCGARWGHRRSARRHGRFRCLCRFRRHHRRWRRCRSRRRCGRCGSTRQTGLRIILIRGALLLIGRHRLPAGGAGLHARLRRGRRSGLCECGTGQKGKRNGYCNCDCAHERNSPVVCHGEADWPRLRGLTIQRIGRDRLMKLALGRRDRNRDLHEAPDRLSPCRRNTRS